MKAKFLSIILASLLVLGIAAGCSPKEEAELDGETVETSADTDGNGKTLRIAFPDTLTTVDVADVTASTMLKEVGGVVETLVYADADFNLTPLLATEWEMTGDYTWVFKLRDDVTFHDGTKFNADAVKWCIERIHSFPTRRSSDQSEERRVGKECKIGRDRLRGIAVRAFFRRPRRSGAASCRHCP